MSEIKLVTLITPKADKMERCVELLSSLASSMKANEPGCLQYQLNRQADCNNEGLSELIIFESYKDQSALAAHTGSAEYQTVMGTALKEELLAKQLQVIPVEPVGGFAARA